MKKNIIIPIIVSILASIIYSKLIDPNLDNTFNYVGSFLASLSNNYLNYLYENIGDGIKEIFSYYPYAIIFGFPLIITFNFTIIILIKSFLKRTKNESQESEESKTSLVNSIKLYNISPKVNRFILASISASFFLYLLTATIKHHYTYNAIIYIEKSLDIIAPKINEQKRLELKAKYRQIDNYEKFNSFNNEIKEIAESNKIKLPLFKIIVK